MITASQVSHVGFSGSREGMSKRQLDIVRHWLLEICMYPNAPIWFHHGDCIGADAEAHQIAKEYGYKIHLHPPLDPKYRANLGGECNIVEECWSYHGRNQRILKASQLLIATPKKVLSQGGGTWYTILKAIEWKIPRIVVDPDGNITKEGIL